MKNLNLFILGLILLGLIGFKLYIKKNREMVENRGKIDEELKQNIEWLEKRGYIRKLSLDFDKDGWVKNGIFIPYADLTDPEKPDNDVGLDHEKFTQRVLKIEKEFSRESL